MDIIKTCSRCILDSSVPKIRFDSLGVCGYCKIQDIMDEQHKLGEFNEKKLSKIVNDIKKAGKNYRYDCIVGVSGGTDSTYLLYMVKSLGLRPLAVHLDNGWDSELAVSNIKKVITKLGIDLHTVVLDWEEFKDLQVAFLKASVPDAEIPTDLAIEATLYKIAAREKIHYIISGHNFRTEGKVPSYWNYADWRYIKSVYQMFGKNKKLKNYPKFSVFDRLYSALRYRVKEVRFLCYIDYNKKKIENFLNDEFGWINYGAKHHESVYTRFHHAYYLPKKFDMDFRKVYFSAEVRSKQITRDEALKRISIPAISKKQGEMDKDYVIKKLGLTDEEFNQIMALPPKSFRDYPTYYSFIKLFRRPMKLVYKIISPTTPGLFHEMDFL